MDEMQKKDEKDFASGFPLESNGNPMGIQGDSGLGGEAGISLDAEDKIGSCASEKKSDAQGKDPVKKAKINDPGRKRLILGKHMMVLGGILILGGIGLWSYNMQDAQRAGKTSKNMLPQIHEAIEENVAQKATEGPTEPVHVNPYDQAAVDASNEMTVVVKNGWPYIGFLRAPAIDMELPVLGEWSYFNLGMAPCRHFGSTKSDDIVICAHNYPTHFGHIDRLGAGDSVSFTDMDGVESEYTVVTVDIIHANDLDAVKDPSLDLVMYTCTYGGDDRIMVGCRRVEEDTKEKK